MFVHIGVNYLFRGYHLRGQDMKKSDLQIKRQFSLVSLFADEKEKRLQRCSLQLCLLGCHGEDYSKNQLSSVVI